MSHVLTLIGNKAAPLAEQWVAAVRAALDAGAPDWLAPGLACDLPLADGSEGPEAAARAALDGAPIDIAVVPLACRRKRLLIADMDSTIIQQECIDELADMVGVRDRVAAITERAMRGDIAFEPALKERVALLEGLPLEKLQEVYDTRIALTPGAATLTATMRAHGATCVLVSGGFTFFTERVAQAAGFDREQANRLLHQNGKLTGTVDEPVLGQDAKLAALRSLRAEFGLAPEDTIAVGDGANDLAMVKEAGVGVAFHAKPVVAEQAAVRIDHADLTALLYVQGYRADEIIGA